MVANQQPARSQTEQGQGFREPHLVRLVQDQPVEHLGFLAGQRDPVDRAKDYVRGAHPRIVRLHDASPELWINLLRLGDPDHPQGVETLQPLLGVVDRGVGVGRHQDPNVGIARHQLAHGLDDRGCLSGTGRPLDQHHASREEVDPA